MDNEAGGDDEEGNYSSYNIMSKKRSIEQNSDESKSNNKKSVGNYCTIVNYFCNSWL